MYDHIGLKVQDIDAAVRFYTGRADRRSGLCFAPAMLRARRFGPPGEPALWLYAANSASGSGVHVALRAVDRAAVDRFHTGGIAAGGRDNGRPGLRTDYSPTTTRRSCSIRTATTSKPSACAREARASLGFSFSARRRVVV